MAKKKLSRDQKRKQKLAKRDPKEGQRAQRQQQMATFRAETEQAIHDTFLQGPLRILDADAVAAVGQLMTAAQQSDLADSSAEPANAQALLVQNAKRQWREQGSLEKLLPLLAAQTMQSLSTHIESITTKGESQSYLRYLQGTLKGVAALVEGETADVGANAWSASEEGLRKLGLGWLRQSNEETWGVFQAEAKRLVEAGEGYVVAHVCQYLYGLIQQAPVEQALRPLLDAAHRQIEKQLDKQAAPQPDTTTTAISQPAT